VQRSFDFKQLIINEILTIAFPPAQHKGQ
jgi:hypothetical protein